jgi:hypothetical protein
MDDQGKMEVKRDRYREFTVTPGLRGFKVKIGCSEVYFGDAMALCASISAYLHDPRGVEKEYQSKDIRMGGGVPVDGDACRPPSPIREEPTVNSVLGTNYRMQETGDSERSR